MADSKSTSRRNSAWLTLLIFVVIAHFNPEVLTGSTPVEKYSMFTTLLGMLFYGLQVAIIADLMARYRLRWRTLFLIGLVYGIFEEGFAVQTILSPGPPEFGNVLRVLGLNVTWGVYITIFHAIISVLSSILIIGLIWPARISRSFLQRRHYGVVIPLLTAIYSLFILFETSVYLPEASATTILIATCFVLVLTARRSQRRELRQTPTTGRNYVFWSVLLVLGSGLLPLILAHAPGGPLLTTALLLISGYLLTVFFGRIDRDPHFNGSKRLAIFIVYVGFWLLLGTFFRTPLSSIVAYLGVGLQVYFGWRSSLIDNQPATS